MKGLTLRIPYFLILFCSLTVYDVYGADLPLDKIVLPPGFKIQIYAENLPDARSMALDERGVLLVGSNTKYLYAVFPDIRANGKRKVIRLADNLDIPNGVAIYQNNLYVAEKTRIVRYDNIEYHLTQLPTPVVIFNRLPTENWHSFRYLGIGPDHKIYVAVGAPCNVCTTTNPMHGSILRMNLDGTDLQYFAKGVRNSVGFDWQPDSNLFWFTDNGRDNLGDNLPPDEVNVAKQAGLFFGFPYCYGKNILDKEFDPHASCDGFQPTVYDLPAHSAALGLMFYRGQAFPEKYHNAIFIAAHGSWNRSKKTGYKIFNLQVKGSEVVSVSTFAEGWLQGQEYWGRPVALLTLPDGSLLVSDDYAGVIYQITYNKVMATPKK